MPSRRWPAPAEIAFLFWQLSLCKTGLAKELVQVSRDSHGTVLQRAPGDLLNTSRCTIADPTQHEEYSASDNTTRSLFPEQPISAALLASRDQPLVAKTRASHKGSAGKRTAQVIAEIREENDWKNHLVLFWLPDGFLESLPRVARAWARCYVACMILYFGTGGAWVYYIYAVFGRSLFPGGKMPAAADIAEQIKVSCVSIPFYSMLPAVEEWVMERGWTRAYTRVSDVGIARHITYFVVFMASVEFGVYWMHRLLHDIRPGYKRLHYIHHKYNKENTLSPFAGLAFHPLDGILQAVPYCWTLFWVPAHSLTFELLLFLTGIWTTNIHDCIDGKVKPIMGAGYHTIHHTTYRHNYGHYFIYMDKIFGSLVSPAEFEAAAAQSKPIKAN